MDFGNSNGDTQDSVPYEPEAQAREQKNKTAEASSLHNGSTASMTVACGFFHAPGKKGLPREIRQIIYDEAVSLPWLRSKYKRIMTFDHYIFYEDTSLALALLRNGNIWERGACDAQAVKLAIQPFTLHVYWAALRRRSGTLQGHLVGLLKGLDVVFAMDLEHQRTFSNMPRKWAAPLSPTVLRYGRSTLKCFLAQRENTCTSNNEDRENEWYQKEPPGAFLQTALLHLRRNPTINIRIFVHSPMQLTLNGEWKATYQKWEATHREWDATLAEEYIGSLLDCLKRGMTNTRLPRSAKDYIHHHITLVTYDAEFSYWKERLEGFDGEVQ